MTLVKFTGVTAVKWGATNLSKVYAGDVQVWPHPGAVTVNINLEDGYPYVATQLNLMQGQRPPLPAYEIPLGSNITFAGSTTQKANADPIIDYYCVCDDSGTVLGTLSETQTRYGGSWTFPATGIAAGDISTIKAYMTTPADASAIPFGVIKWLPADGTFRRLPATPTVYQDITIDLTGQMAPGGVPLPSILYRNINQGNATLLPEITGYADGTYRFVYSTNPASPTLLTWALDVAIAGRWWTSGMRPIDCVNNQWVTRGPRWGGQTTKTNYDSKSALWSSNFAAGLVLNDLDRWLYARIGHHGSLIHDYHSDAANPAYNVFTDLGIALPSGMRMEDLPTFTFDTDH